MRAWRAAFSSNASSDCSGTARPSWKCRSLEPSGTQGLAQEKLLNAVRRTGQKARVPGRQQADVLRVERVYVLERRHGTDDSGFIDLRRQGELHQDPVDGGVSVQPADEQEELLLAGFLGQ